METLTVKNLLAHEVFNMAVENVPGTDNKF